MFSTDPKQYTAIDLFMLHPQMTFSQHPVKNPIQPNENPVLVQEHLHLERIFPISNTYIYLEQQ